MKIAHVVRQFYPSVGGLEDYVFNLASEQRAAGHDVQVITLNSDFQNPTGAPLAASDEYQGIAIRRVPWKGSQRYPLCQIDMGVLNAQDIVHVHAVDFLVDYLSIMKRLGRLTSKLVLSTHGGFFHTRKNQLIKKIFFQTVTRFTLSQVDAVMCNSSNDFAVFEPISRMAQLINNGIRLTKFGGEPVMNHETLNDLVYIGRFSSNKRLPWLIEAFAKLPQPAGKLKIIGRRKTGNTDEMLELVKRLGCADKVEFVLDVSDDEIARHITASRFTVSASEYEGFGLGVVELMSYGLVPFLASEPMSFNDFVRDSKSGELFEVEANTFNTQYQKLVSNWSPAAATNAAVYARQFSWTAVAQEIFNVYENTLDNSVRAYR